MPARLWACAGFAATAEVALVLLRPAARLHAPPSLFNILNMHAGTCSRRLCNALRRLRLCCFGMQPSCSPSPCGLNLNVHTGACTRLYCAFCKLTQHEMFLTLHCYCRLCIAIALITLFTGYHIVSHHAGVCGLHRAVFVTCKRICLTQFHNAMLTIVQVIV